MAGDWIKMRTDLYRDPKVILIADSLAAPDGELARTVNQYTQRGFSVTRNVMRNVTVGALVSLWGVARHSGKRRGDDLVIYGATVAVADDIADLPGFGDAVAAVGWIIQEDDCICFPDFFADHNVDPDEKRKAQQRERGQRFRDKQKAGNVTPDNVTRTHREEKRREEKRIDKHTPREAAPDFVELDPPTELAPDGRSWVHVEADFLTAWNSLPTGKRGVVPVTGLPPLMSVKDRAALRRVWPAKETSARKAMNRIADGSAFGWDRNPLTIQQFFEEIDNILGGKHERFTDSTSGRHSARTRGGRVDSQSDIDELLARPVDDRRPLAVSTGT